MAPCSSGVVRLQWTTSRVFENLLQVPTMMRRSSASKYQMRNVRCVFYGILLRQETAKASPTDNDLFIRPGKAHAYTFNIIDYLLESVWLGPGTLPMAPEIEGKDTESVAEGAVNIEIRFVVTCSTISWTVSESIVVSSLPYPCLAHREG